VRATSAAGEARRVRQLLSTARPALAEMVANGYNERFGKAATPGEIQSFKENIARLEALEATAASHKAQLAELQARGQARGDEGRELLVELREVSSEAAELKELITTQKSIAGFWIAPRDVYTRKLGEVRALEGRLQLLSEHESASHADGDPPPALN